MRAAPCIWVFCWVEAWVVCGDVCTALEMVEEELPVVPDQSLARNAQILLDACHSAGLLDWSIALALALDNTLLLAGQLAAHISTCSHGIG